MSRDTGRDLAQRFRAACSTFFTRRREDLTDRKKIWSDNLAKKEALCARAEALADSTDWDAAAAEMKRLQAEWKTIGPVRRNKSEVVWNRFRAAADRFFDRYHNRHEITLADEARRTRGPRRRARSAGGDRSDDLEPTSASASSSFARPGTAACRSRSPEMQGADRSLAGRADRTSSPWRRRPSPARISIRPSSSSAWRSSWRRVEAFLEELDELDRRACRTPRCSPRKLRSALATNAMGGRVNEDAKWRAAADAVKDAQAAWQRLRVDAESGRRRR